MVQTSGKPQGSVPRTEANNFRDSDGNRVNIGNFDDKGLNINNYWDDKPNHDIGVASSRQSTLYRRTPAWAGVFVTALWLILSTLRASDRSHQVQLQ